MGVCVSSDPQAAAAKRQSTEVDNYLKGVASRDRKIIKLLLLGAGESGKSTLVKQMKIIHSDGFSDEDCLGFKRALYVNLVEGMRAIVENMDILGIDYENPQLEQRANEILTASVPDTGDLDFKILKTIEQLWIDRGIQRCFEHAHEYHISDGAGYQFNNLKRYMTPGFIPNTRDVLHIRIRTLGIIDTEFTYKKTNFQLYDVGGQRSERWKWIHCFDNVTAIIFCAAMSGYDSTCVEDGTTLRLHESLDLFDMVCNSKYLQRASMLLFLNKTDILQRKVYTSPLTVCFPEYGGKQTYEEVSRYIQNKFVERNRTRDPDRVYVHKTCATDTTIVERVFHVAANSIMRENLERIVS